MNISAAMVKELRAVTGAGIMDAKNALVENDGNIEASVDWLRTKGIAKAAKKSGRTAAEGQVGVLVEGGVGVAVEINSETDFVARNSEFVSFVRRIAKAALGADTVEELMQIGIDGGKVEDALTGQIAALGENLVIRRMRKLTGDSVASYVHNQTEDGIGKIGVLVALSGKDAGIGRQMAMHVAAANPIALSEKEVPVERVERERQVLAEIARESGKPDNIVEKMVEGGMRKFFATETLMNQKFVINPEITVAQAAKEAGVEIRGFAFLRVGEQD